MIEEINMLSPRLANWTYEGIEDVSTAVFYVPSVLSTILSVYNSLCTACVMSIYIQFARIASNHPTYEGVCWACSRSITIRRNKHAVTTSSKLDV